MWRSWNGVSVEEMRAANVENEEMKFEEDAAVHFEYGAVDYELF